jgi:urease accessory protein
MRPRCTRHTFSLRLIACAAASVAAWPAAAHHAMDNQTPRTLFEGLASGLAHPVIGPDHLAFLVVAALLVAAFARSARFLVPLIFVAATIAGTTIHLRATDLPMVETMVSLSVLAGAILLLRGHGSAFVLGMLFAVSGLLHGYAYGESIIGAESPPLLAYLLGFAVIQYLLIVGGAHAVDAISRRSPGARRFAVRVGASFAMLTGAVFLGLSLA